MSLSKGVRDNGSVFKAEIEFSHAEVEGENCTQVVVRDENKHEEVDSDQLQLLRDHDFLTGLYNRVRFMDELENCLLYTSPSPRDRG